MPDFSRFNLTPAQQAHLASITGRAPITSMVGMDGSPRPLKTNDQIALEDAGRLENHNRSMASHNRLVNFGRLASIAPLAFAAPAFAGTGAGATASLPAAATEGIAFDAVAPAVSMGSRIGSFLGSRGAETGINAALSLFGMRSQNKANDQARRDALAAQAKEIEIMERQIALAQENANLDREDARKLNDAIQALENKKFALQQEQVAYERGIIDEDRAVSADYRNRIGIPAQRRIASILGL